MSATTLSGDDPPRSLHLSFRGKPYSDDMGVLGNAPESRIGAKTPHSPNIFLLEIRVFFQVSVDVPGPSPGCERGIGYADWLISKVPKWI